MSFLEWTLLGDLRRPAVDLPDEVPLKYLEWHTTGGIARRIEKHAAGISAGPTRDHPVVATDAFKRCRHCAVNFCTLDLLQTRWAVSG